MSQMLFKTGGQCLAIFWFVNDSSYWALGNMGTQRQWGAGLEGLHSVPFVKYLKVQSKLPLLAPRGWPCLLQSRNTTCSELPFHHPLYLPKLWGKLLSAANLACWEAGVGMTQCGHNKKVKKRVNIVSCGFSCLLTSDFRMKVSWKTTSWLAPASIPVRGSCALWTLYWISSVFKIFLLSALQVQGCTQEWGCAAHRSSCLLQVTPVT